MGVKKSDHSGEERIIDLFRPFVRHPGALGLLDDCAVLPSLPGTDLVLKADAIIGGIHFLHDDPPALVARKALRVNLSDLAAKGAKPLGFLLSLAVPEEIGESWLERFARGLGEDSEQYKCPLLGGDTDRTTGPLVVSIAALGSLPSGTMVKRSTAKIGDYVVVTGTIGDAALGLRVAQDAIIAGQWGLTASQAQHLFERYRLPQPRNVVAEAVRRYASAAIDISDGLAGDLAKLCAASGVSADIEAGRVPLSEAAHAALFKEPALLESILTGGDDYEILATVEPAKLDPFCAAAAAAGVPLTPMGHMVKGNEAPRFATSDGTPLAFSRASFSHF